MHDVKIEPHSRLATLHDSQSPSGFGADKTITVVHDCVYCYIFRNAHVSRTCAGLSEKLGTFRDSRSNAPTRGDPSGSDPLQVFGESRFTV